MHNLKRLGFCGKYYWLIHSFLNDKHQRVVLNGQRSNWSKIKAGVPQSSILGPLSFLVCTNNLPEGLTTNAKNTKNSSMGLPMTNDTQPRCLKTSPRGCFFS